MKINKDDHYLRKKIKLKNYLKNHCSKANSSHNNNYSKNNKIKYNNNKTLSLKNKQVLRVNFNNNSNLQLMQYINLIKILKKILIMIII